MKPDQITLSEEDRRLIGLWAADCAEWVLPLFEGKAPSDTRPREAIEGNVFLHTQVALAPAVLGLALAWAWAQLIWEPEGDFSQPYVMNRELADRWGIERGTRTMVWAEMNRGIAPGAGGTGPWVRPG